MTTYNYPKKTEALNFVVKLGMLSSITIGGFILADNKPAFAQSQSFSQCVLNLYKGPYNARDAATNCLQAFQGKRVNEEFTTCVNALYRGPYNQNDASSYCQQAFTNALQENNSRERRPEQGRGGNPQAIADCMKKLMYERQPVCTRNGNCARIGSPAENANNNFGGWQWQTVRANISENGAAQACQNAR